MAFCLALLLVPLARGNALRAILFGLIAMIVAWLQMAVTVNAGGSVHHAILIWPFPYLVIAVSFASASRRLRTAGIPALAVVMVTMMNPGQPSAAQPREPEAGGWYRPDLEA